MLKEAGYDKENVLGDEKENKKQGGKRLRKYRLVD